MVAAQYTRPILLDMPRKPSTPIEIPQPRGRRPARPMSPELIFEMSPIDSWTAQYSLAVLSPDKDIYDCYPLAGNRAWARGPASPKSPFHEPFMYSFPRLPPNYIKASCTDSHDNSSTVEQPEECTSPVQVDNTGLRSPMHHQRRTLTTAFWREDELPLSSGSQCPHPSSHRPIASADGDSTENKDPGDRLPRVRSALAAQLADRCTSMPSPVSHSPAIDPLSDVSAMYANRRRESQGRGHRSHQSLSNQKYTK